MRDETKEELRNAPEFLDEIRDDYIEENKTELVAEAQKQADEEISEIKNTLSETVRPLEGKIALEKRINAMMDSVKESTSILGKTTTTIKFDGTAEEAIDEGASEKFAFRCFLLRLGFIGKEHASARKVLLSKLSGNGSFKSGDHKARAAPAPHVPVTAYNGDDGTGGAITHDEVSVAVSGNDGDSGSTDADAVIVVPERCADCPHHCYYSDGEMRSDGGKVVDISAREPQKYTHYCTETPRGFKRLKHANDWHGGEAPPSWCPLRSTVAAESIEEGGAADE